VTLINNFAVTQIYSLNKKLFIHFNFKIYLRNPKNEEEKNIVVREFVKKQMIVAKGNIKQLVHDCPKMKDVWF
jgi:hypothetical protein